VKELRKLNAQRRARGLDRYGIVIGGSSCRE
jgi:hypothetical protein